MRPNRTDIVGTAAIAVASTAAALAGAPVPVLAVLGILLFAAPGYVVGEVLLGARIAGLERVAVMGGLALAVPVLGGFALYAGGVPLNRTAWTCLLAGVTLAGDLVLAARRQPTVRKEAGASRPRALRLSARQLAAFGAAVVIAAGGIGIARVGAAVQHYPGFSELWISPVRAAPGSADLGVSNHEGRTEQYRLVLNEGGRTASSWNVTLRNGAIWERAVTVGSGTTADLYRLPDATSPYRHVTVSGPGSA